MSLSFSVLSNCLTCASNQHPLKCSVPLLETIPSRCLQMWGQSGNMLSVELWGGRLSGTLGPPFESRISLMIFALLVAAIGLSRMFLRRLLTGSSPSQYHGHRFRPHRRQFSHQSSNAFSYSKKKPDHTEMKLRRWTTRTKATHAVR